MRTAACCNFVRDVSVGIIVKRFSVKSIKISGGGFQ